ncbi:hypothetical protein PFISCL1PPCAC_11002, partial [Pristionchus fissidentatus]
HFVSGDAKSPIDFSVPGTLPNFEYLATVIFDSGRPRLRLGPSMEYSYPGGGANDPFRCLDSDLDEMLNNLNDPNLNSHHGESLEAMDTTGPAMNYNPTTPPSAYLHQSIVSHSSSHAPLSVSPPFTMGLDANGAAPAPVYNYYKQTGAGMPQQQHMQQDPYGAANSAATSAIENGYGEFKFSPPDFNQMGGAPARMLPGIRDDTKYYNHHHPQQLQQQPHHQSRHAQHARMNAVHQDMDIATLLTPMEQKLAMRHPHPSAVIVKRERSPEMAPATRDQLIKLLTSLSKSEVDKLQESIDAVAVPTKSVIEPSPEQLVPTVQPSKQQPSQSSVIAAVGRVRPSAVATRVYPKYEQQTVQQHLQSPPLTALSLPLIPAADLRVRHESFDDFDDEDDEEEEMMMRMPGSRKTSTVGSEFGGPIRPKTERRTAHNLIEKKYRCSINDRIQALKNMLAGGAKMSKSATLRRAIEYIEELEGKNRELTTMVNSLSSVCAANGIDASKCLIIDPSSQSPHSAASSPPMSTSSSNQTSPVPQSHTISKKRSRMSMDHNTARVSLCAIMFALIVWNPIASFTSRPSLVTNTGAELAAHLPSRTLQSLDEAFDSSYSHDNDHWWQDNVIRPCFTWTINIVLVICVLSRLLVYGEPVQDMKSRTWASFLATKKQAHSAFEMGNHKEAHRQLVECLNILDRPLPSSFFEESMAIIWQIIRHLLNSLWIGRWFSRRRRDERKPVTVVCKSHAHTAMIYHQLNQLDLLGIDGDLSPSTRLRGLYFGLTAVNISESAGSSVDGLPHIDHANIHMGAALRCRLNLPKFVAPVLCKYFFTRSRRHVRKMSPGSVPSLSFIFHPLCRKFIADPTRLKNCLEDGMSGSQFTKSSVKGLSIDRIRNAFKVHLLNQLLDSLRQPNPAGSAHYTTLDIVDASQLLLTISTSASPPTSCTSFGWEDGGVRGDEISTWWAHVLTCGMLWRQDKLEQAKSHYAMVRKVPPQLMNNPLTLAVGHAFCARKLRTNDMTHANSPHLVKHNSQKAIEFLRTLPVINGADGAAVVKLQESLRLLSLEWILCSVLAAWRSQLDQSSPYWSQEVSPDWLAIYQSAHSMVMQYSAAPSIGKKKKKEDELEDCQQTGFSLTSRMLAGANAVQTYSELLRLQRKVNEKYARLPSTRDDTALSYHLHVLTKLHLCMNGSPFRVKSD